MNRNTFLTILIIFSIATSIYGDDEFKHVEDSGVQLRWKIDGDELHLVLTAPTEGWVAVGFNPTVMMKDADFKLLSVDGSTVIAEDHFGSGRFSHRKDTELGGSDDFEIISGTESNGSTTVEFKLPLDSGDENDSVLAEGQEVKVLLAYGKSDNMRRKHSWRTSLTVRL